MSLTRNDFISLRAREEDAEELVDYPRSVANVKVAAFLREVAGGRVRVSLRAKSDVPVNRIARHFGGGGHAYAAGCTVERATIPEARRRLTEAVRKEMRRSRT
jgi:phosphoesterase RecJ-like protein